VVNNPHLAIVGDFSVIFSDRFDQEDFLMSIESRKEINELRRAQVAEFEDSDVPAKQWCAENHISISTLHYWQRKLRQEKARTNNWVDISGLRQLDPDCTAIVPVSHGSVTIRIGPYSVEVTRSTDTECLRTVLSVTATLC
jgi:hypothetical protein